MGNLRYTFGIGAGDLDGDGDVDLTVANCTGPEDDLYWFENDGHGAWTKRCIQTNDPGWFERHVLGDVDDDGDLDVAVVKNLAGEILWFENNGNPQDGNLWRRHVLTNSFPKAYDVVLADLDGDGDLDAAGSRWEAKKVAWFKISGQPAAGTWRKHDMVSGPGDSRAILAADFDGDGDTDLAGTFRHGNRVVWFENRISPAVTGFTEHVIDGAARRPTHGHAVDLDADGDPDLLMASGYEDSYGGPPPAGADTEVAWYENDASLSEVWAKHVIIKPYPGAFEAVSGDLDGDGDLDVVATAMGQEGETGRLFWFENTGDPEGSWTAHLIKNGWSHAMEVLREDFDGDGKLDIALCAATAVGYGNHEVRWFRNTTVSGSESACTTDASADTH